MVDFTINDTLFPARLQSATTCECSCAMNCTTTNAANQKKMSTYFYNSPYYLMEVNNVYDKMSVYYIFMC